jgi:hypothetical protein
MTTTEKTVVASAGPAVLTRSMHFRLAEAYGLVRFAFGLRPFLRDRITFEQAERLVRQGVAGREERFGGPASMYTGTS